MCVRARVRGTVWCVVSRLRGVPIWPFNRMEQNQHVRARFFLCRRRGEGSGSLPFFWWVEITFDLGVEMSWWFFFEGKFVFIFYVVIRRAGMPGGGAREYGMNLRRHGVNSQRHGLR